MFWNNDRIIFRCFVRFKVQGCMLLRVHLRCCALWRVATSSPHWDFFLRMNRVLEGTAFISRWWWIHTPTGDRYNIYFSLEKQSTWQWKRSKRQKIMPLKWRVSNDNCNILIPQRNEFNVWGMYMSGIGTNQKRDKFFFPLLSLNNCRGLI